MEDSTGGVDDKHDQEQKVECCEGSFGTSVIHAYAKGRPVRRTSASWHRAAAPRAATIPSDRGWSLVLHNGFCHAHKRGH